jgi:purine-nucleoside phosphorylase
MPDPGAPFDLARRAAAVLAERTGTAHHEVVVVLGTGLRPVATALGAADAPVPVGDVPGFGRFTAPAHFAGAHSLDVAGRTVLVFTGRHHLYEGCSPAEVVHGVRTAVAMGCSTVILTSAVGGIRADLVPASVMLVTDHLNLTGRSPLEGIPAGHPVGDPFVDLTDCWSARLRELAHDVEPGLPSGVYAQMPGPHFETPAEIRMLATLGADVVGMSTVPEAIAARHLGAEVLGLSVVTNPAAGLSTDGIDVTAFADAAGGAVATVGRVIQGVVARLGPPAQPSQPPQASGLSD